MKLRSSKRALVAAVAVAGLATTGLLSPVHAATRSTVVVHETNAFTSLNTGTSHNKYRHHLPHRCGIQLLR